jgi:hypothetical protein
LTNRQGRNGARRTDNEQQFLAFLASVAFLAVQYAWHNPSRLTLICATRYAMERPIECVSGTFHETLGADAIPLQVKELVRSVKRGHRHVENAHPAYRPMAAARLDENCIAGPNRMPLAVQLNLAAAFEDVVDLGSS